MTQAGVRTGGRIRRIRTEKGLSQAELGTMVGLTADRIQKYENGARKPKLDLIKMIAEALGVESMALIDPDVSSDNGSMYAFFEMEELYALKPIEVNGKIVLMAGDGITGTLNNYLEKWYKRLGKKEADLEVAPQEIKDDVIKDYHDWKWKFPKSLEAETKRIV